MAVCAGRERHCLTLVLPSSAAQPGWLARTLPPSPRLCLLDRTLNTQHLRWRISRDHGFHQDHTLEIIISSAGWVTGPAEQHQCGIFSGLVSHQACCMNSVTWCYMFFFWRVLCTHRLYLSTWPRLLSWEMVNNKVLLNQWIIVLPRIKEENYKTLNYKEMGWYPEQHRSYTEPFKIWNRCEEAKLNNFACLNT